MQIDIKMNKIIIILLIIYTIDLCLNLFNFIKIKKWFAQPDNYLKKSNKTNLYILIPMMNEQVIAQETFKHFYNFCTEFTNYKVVYITTDRETKKTGKEHTYDILNKMCVQYNSPNIFLFHYTGKGIMSHQLNYAIKMIDKFDEDDYWIAIYNADSRITKETFLAFESMVSTWKNEPVCFQQYSYYSLPSGIKKKSIIGSAVLWQNRWSLLFEMSRVIYQNWLDKKLRRYGFKLQYILNILIGKMNYVIGHGLYIRRSVLQSVGFFPENSINEDAFLGFLLNEARIKIIPFKELEHAEFVDRIDSYIKQQNVWFNGPFDAFKYYKSWINSGNRSIERKINGFILCIKLFMHSIYWILSPFILIILLPILCILTKNFTCLIISILLCICLLPLINMLISQFLKKNFSKNNFPEASFANCLLFYLIHSFGPLYNIILRCQGRNNIHNKYKTRRNENLEE